MKNDDFAEALVFGGIVGIVLNVVLAPFVLFLYIMSLFFRAPLAAIFATFFCGAIAWILLMITVTTAANMSPFGGFMFTLFMLFVAAGVAYGIRSFEFSSMVFNLECFVLEKSILKLGVLGRAFYLFAQLIPSLVIIFLLASAFFGPGAIETASDANFIITMLILGWFALSQFMVLRFHRTSHPVGQFLSFTGVPLEGRDQDGIVSEK